MCNKNPYRPGLLPIPHDVKDVIRTLLHEIHVGRLDSLLIYDKRKENNPSPIEFYLHTHLEEIFECIGNKSYPRKLLKFITIDRYAFHHWCEQSNIELPIFWYSSILEEWSHDDYDDEDGYKLSRPIHLTYKEKARNVASKLWKTNPMLPVLQIARSDDMKALKIPRSEDSIRKWIAPLRPKENLAKLGRPLKEVK